MNNEIKHDKNYNYFYSASAPGFVYRPYDNLGDCPDDLKPISDELHGQLLVGQATGKIITADKNGFPILVEPPPPTPEELQLQAESQKRQLLKTAAEKIDICQDAVDLNIATDAEQSALTEWRRYRVLLNRVDCTTAPDIQWPEQPE
ncbi:tail fiber assembly protein [Xenorhabdus nematophila]|uniref:tail fiber assembly protein n=1 Tax=Xenorhabdus nematophila TaxID=628 RepID=UPI0032B7D424